MIEFGKTYHDIVTDFEGICTGMVEWLYGCKQYILQPKGESSHKKEHGAMFFEKQLEYVNDGIADKIEAPEILPQRFFGKDCLDKVTGLRGICIGRYIWLFNCDQYVIEYRPEETSKDTKMTLLDEGRLEIVADSDREIAPEDVASPREG